MASTLSDLFTYNNISTVQDALPQHGAFQKNPVYESHQKNKVFLLKNLDLNSLKFADNLRFEQAYHTQLIMM